MVKLNDRETRICMILWVIVMYLDVTLSVTNHSYSELRILLWSIEYNESKTSKQTFQLLII